MSRGPRPQKATNTNMNAAFGPLAALAAGMAAFGYLAHFAVPALASLGLN